jgi:hypothetical protein
MRELINDWKKINGINTIDELELELKRMELKERGALREFRAFYSGALFLLTIVWILVVLLIVLLNTRLSDKILIALITTTTINVFAFFVLVVKYMFATPKDTTLPPKQPK